MTEIPAGKWCYSRGVDMRVIEGCPFTYMETGEEDSFNACLHPDFCDADIVEDAKYQPLRCLACLSAYPNGAVIEIKPK